MRERVYDGKWPGIGPFELHMGPYHEFALFRGIQDEHRDHNSADNLLKPYNVEIRANAARQSWDVDGLHLEDRARPAARASSASRGSCTLKRGRDDFVSLPTGRGHSTSPNFRQLPGMAI